MLGCSNPGGSITVISLCSELWLSTSFKFRGWLGWKKGLTFVWTSLLLMKHLGHPQGVCLVAPDETSGSSPGSASGCSWWNIWVIPRECVWLLLMKHLGHPQGVRLVAPDETSGSSPGSASGCSWWNIWVIPREFIWLLLMKHLGHPQGIHLVAPDETSGSSPGSSSGCSWWNIWVIPRECGWSQNQSLCCILTCSSVDQLFNGWFSVAVPFMLS